MLESPAAAVLELDARSSFASILRAGKVSVGLCAASCEPFSTTERCHAVHEIYMLVDCVCLEHRPIYIPCILIWLLV